MFCKKNLIFLGVVCLSLFLSATWSIGGSRSGFISSDLNFHPHPEYAGSMLYMKPGLDLTVYSKILIDPIEIWVDPNSKYKGLDPDESKKIADSLRYVLTRELEPEYPVVGQVGPGVFGIRLAITNVNMKKKKRGLLGYTPAGFALTAAADMAGLRMDLDKATIEAEFIDAVSGELVGAMIHPFVSYKKEKINWATLIQALDNYAKRLRKRLDKNQGK